MASPTYQIPSTHQAGSLQQRYKWKAVAVVPHHGPDWRGACAENVHHPPFFLYGEMCVPKSNKSLGSKCPQKSEMKDAGRAGQESQTMSLMQMLREPQHMRQCFSVIATLTIGIMGGAVLPVAWAFSVTGMGVGVMIMVVVSLANVYTSDLLLRQSYKTGAWDYESLAFKIGGRWWQLVTEMSIVILLLGTLVGGILQVGEAGSIGLLSIWPNTPGWLVDGSGRFVMALGTVLVTAPLSFMQRLTQLEYAGMLGTCIVLWLLTVVIIDSSKSNLPAISNGEFQGWGFSSLTDITQAVSIFGFAFYTQPIMMPLILEMVPGKVGAKLISWGNRFVVLGIVSAFLIYLFVGFFGAARYGLNTQSNILQNVWLGGGVAQGILNLSMAFYLALANPLIEFPLRHTGNGWLPGDKDRLKRVRHLFITSVILGVGLAIAEAVPNSSGKVLTATGATGVCLVSYFIPIVNHLLLFFHRALCQQEAPPVTHRRSSKATEAAVAIEMVNQPATHEQSHHITCLSYRNVTESGYKARACEMTKEVMIPVLVLALGIFCSVSALSTLAQD